MSKENKKNVVEAKSLYKTSEETMKAADRYKKSGESTQKGYQRVICSALVHLSKHGNVGIISKVVNEMPESLRKDSMQKFIETFGQVTFAVDKETGKLKKDENGHLVPTFDKNKKLQLGLALETPWWKMIKQSEYKPFDLNAEIDKLIQRAENKLTKGISEEKGDKIDREQISKLKKALTTVEGK